MMALQLLGIPQADISSTQYQQLEAETHVQKCSEMQNEITNLNFS